MASIINHHQIICADVGKNQPETLTSFIIVGAACLQLTAADFVPFLDQRALFGTISFIKKFKFETK